MAIEQYLAFITASNVFHSFPRPFLRFRNSVFKTVSSLAQLLPRSLPFEANAQVRFSIFYFFLSFAQGVSLAFFPLHCSYLGFTPFQIAIAAAAQSFATLVGAPTFAAISHRYISPRKLLFVSSILTCLLYLPLLVVSSFATVFPIWLAYLLIFSAMVVTIDTRAVIASTNKEIRFERARLWGSIGFVASLATIGFLIDLFGLQAIMWVGFSCACALHGLYYLIKVRMPTECGRQRMHLVSPTPWRSFAGPLAIVLGATALLWASHSAYYVYFSIYLKSLGWSGTSIAAAWNTGVVAEIVLFINFHRLSDRFPLTRIFVVAGVLAVVRWIVLAQTSHPETLVLIQILHAASFGAVYLSSIRLVQRIAPPDYRERAQGLLVGLSSGGGSLLGRVGFGYLAVSIADPRDFDILFWPSAAIAALGTLLVLLAKEPPAIPEQVLASKDV